MDNLRKPPVIFTVFANPKGDLDNLTQEQNGIQDVLSPLEADGLVKHLLRTETEIDAYFEFLQEWENQITIFHFAGHASDESLFFQNEAGIFKPLAEELYMRNKNSLLLVFLNGCSTESHLQALFDLGVPAVIATSAAINDSQATLFAVQFYDNLANGDKLEPAYKSAANFIKGRSAEKRFQNLGKVQTWRGTGFDPALQEDQFPWGLYLSKPGVLTKKRLIEVPEIQDNSQKTLFNLHKKCLRMWQIATGFITISVLTQTIHGSLDGITFSLWAWVLTHFYIGLVVLIWSYLKQRDSRIFMDANTYRMVLRSSFSYLFLATVTLLVKPILPYFSISLLAHLQASYIWLVPFNGLLLWMYIRLFYKRSYLGR